MVKALKRLRLRGASSNMLLTVTERPRNVHGTKGRTFTGELQVEGELELELEVKRPKPSKTSGNRAYSAEQGPRRPYRSRNVEEQA